ncbi:ribonuclease P protein component [Leptothermofonsia sp. ETS-13]|uniref:ribonuclease P protein component n=1 Tax=Leptothermofonsia sp. ETS-13 TaxID=3035696 RepID=UPI003B9DF29C
MALPKANRLRQREDFNRVYQKGDRRRSRHLTLVALKQPVCDHPPFEGASATQKPFGLNHLPPTRIGVSISQKVSKRAVVRNRIKRQIQAALYQLLPAFPSGWSLVIVVHPSAVQCDYIQFLRELEQLLMDAEVLNGHS